MSKNIIIRYLYAALGFFFGHILDNSLPDGVVISRGAILLAFLSGYLIKYTYEIVQKIA